MALRISRASAPEPVRTWTLPSGVQVFLDDNLANPVFRWPDPLMEEVCPTKVTTSWWWWKTFSTEVQRIRKPWSKSFHITHFYDFSDDPNHFSFTFTRSLTAHLVGRLPNGCIFESTEGKGGSPMEMQLKKGAVIPGMDLALQDWDQLRSLVSNFFDLHMKCMCMTLLFGQYMAMRSRETWWIAEM